MISFGKNRIRIEGENREKVARVLEEIISYQSGRGFCPVCGSVNIRWRKGIYFDNEKRCSDCNHCWEIP